MGYLAFQVALLGGRVAGPYGAPGACHTGPPRALLGWTSGSPRFPLKGSFKGDIEVGLDIDEDIDLDGLWGLSKSA